MPWPASVIPRSARWNACECALARPGRVRPGRRSVPGGTASGGTSGVTARNTPSLASISTPDRTSPRPSQASSACQRRTPERAAAPAPPAAAGPPSGAAGPPAAAGPAPPRGWSSAGQVAQHGRQRGDPGRAVRVLGVLGR